MAKTVLLTGVAGFIGKHIARVLLERGYFVLGTLRNVSHAADVRDALANTPDLDRLKFVQLDLLSDAGWSQALRGIDSVIHTAAPFPYQSATDPNDLICPVVEGTGRILRAAQETGTQRIVITGSIASIVYGKPEGPAFGPDDWTDLQHPRLTAHAAASTMAEKFIWDWADRHPNTELTVLNAGVALGTALGTSGGASFVFTREFMAGNIKLRSDHALPIVDVRDLAELHVRALDAPATIGRRFPVVETVVSLTDLADHLNTQVPDAPLKQPSVTRTLIASLPGFDGDAASNIPFLDPRLAVDMQTTRRSFDMTFRSGLSAAVETAQSVVNAQSSQ